MSTMRVTEQSMSARMLAGMQSGQSRLENIRQQVSSGKQVVRPSDSPTGTLSAMRLRADLAAGERYTRSAADGVARMSAAEGALSSASTLLQRAKDTVLQGVSSGSYGTPAAREALATEIDALRSSLLGVANTSYLGRPVFGGTTGGQVAFAPSGAYVGDTGQVMRRVADQTEVRVDVSAAVFGAGPTGLFDVLTSISNHLRTNPAALTGDVERLNSATTVLDTELASVGTRYGQLTAAVDAAEAQAVAMSSRLSDIEDVDLVKAVIDLQTQNLGYQAALAATARIQQPSLMDFLR